MEVEEFLEHFGTRGMRWGVRKGSLGIADLSTVRGVGTLTAPGHPKLSKKEIENASRASEQVAELMLHPKTGVLGPNGELTAVNSKYAAAHPGKMSGEVLKNYDKEAASALTEGARKHVPKNADALVVINATSLHLFVGDKETVAQFRLDHDIKHSDMNETRFEIRRDTNGFIIKIEPVVLKQSDSLSEFLSHYGVRGMHWGVRKGPTYVKSGVTNGNLGSAKIGKKQVPLGSYRPGDHTKSRLKGVGLNIIGNLGSAYVAPLATRWGHVKPIVDRNIKTINSKYEAKLSNPSLKAKYDEEIQKMVINTFKNTTNKGLVFPSASSRLASKHTGDLKNAKYDFYTNGKEAYLRVTTDKKVEDLRVGKFKHAENKENAVTFDIPVFMLIDDKGFVMEVSIPELEDFKHFTDVEEFLSHYGVRGMHWGVRRQRSSAGSSAPAPKSKGKPPWQSKPPKHPRSNGSGSAHPTTSHVSNDQIVFQALKNKAKTHGIHSLSNDEIRVLTNRAEVLKKAQTAFPKAQTRKQKVAKRAGKVIENVLLSNGEALLKEVIKNKGTVKLQDMGHLPKKDSTAEKLKKAGITINDTPES